MNTGMSVPQILVQVYTDVVPFQPTGLTKPNLVTDQDYVAPSYDPDRCPVNQNNNVPKTVVFTNNTPALGENEVGLDRYYPSIFDKDAVGLGNLDLQAGGNSSTPVEFNCSVKPLRIENLIQQARPETTYVLDVVNTIGERVYIYNVTGGQIQAVNGINSRVLFSNETSVPVNLTSTFFTDAQCPVSNIKVILTRL